MAIKTKSGKWAVRWYELGIKRQRTFPKKVLADEFEAELTLSKFTTGVKDNVRFGEFLEQWKRDYATAHQVGGTRLNHSYLIDREILPAFRGYKLGDITPALIDRFKSNLLSQGLKPKSVNNYLGILKQILATAVRWNFLRENPAKGIANLKIQRQEMAFWNFEEKARFLSYVKERNQKVYDIVAFAVNTGLRKGEIEGLMRDSVDFERREILVKRSYCKHQRQLVETTKGKRFRRVPMNETVYEIMRRRSLVPLNEKVFHDTKNLSQFGQNYLDRYCQDAKVTRLRFHDLRHTFITHLAMLGVPPIEIQYLSGHTRMATTERYMHFAPNRSSNATTLLDGRALDAPEAKSKVLPLNKR